MLLRRTSEIDHLYTDYHDVDEGSKTIDRLGGRWSDNVGVGVVLRQMYDSPSYTAGTVASSTVEILILFGCA